VNSKLKTENRAFWQIISKEYPEYKEYKKASRITTDDFSKIFKRLNFLGLQIRMGLGVHLKLS
jgi:hypothetical protein